GGDGRARCRRRAARTAARRRTPSRARRRRAATPVPAARAWTLPYGAVGATAFQYTVFPPEPGRVGPACTPVSVYSIPVAAAVWVFDVDGCIVDSLTGTSLRPGARELLEHLRTGLGV